MKQVSSISAIFFALSFLFACSSTGDKKELTVKNIRVVEKVFSPERVAEREYEFYLEIREYKDSCISYSYHFDSLLLSSVEFSIMNGGFVWKQDPKLPEVKLIDTFTARISENPELVYKFLLLSTADSNDIYYYFTKNYGKVASSSKSLGTLQILSEWDNISTEEDLTTLLFYESGNTDSVDEVSLNYPLFR